MMKIEPKLQPENAAEFLMAQDDVFGRIANRYDLLCDLFSLGVHRLWKRRVAKVITNERWSRMLDCATGTGDIVLRVLSQRQLQTAQVIIASDISPQMLAIARQRLSTVTAQIEYRILDAHSMPGIENSSIDLYCISLGLKICDREKVLREAIRVLRPGGRLVILEASKIRMAWLQYLYLQYMKTCMPVIGWLATRGDTSAYQYLLKGIEKFPNAEMLAEEVSLIGFEDVIFELLSFGIVALHVARKPMRVNSVSTT